MKRFRDCMLVCNAGQTPEDLLLIIEQTSITKGYNLQKITSIVNKDTLIVQFRADDLPYSRIVLGIYSERKGVSIVNIVPMLERGTSELSPEVYNKILELFKEDVFEQIKKERGNSIETNDEDYSIEEVIPKSFSKLNAWLSGYPLSSHPNDTQRWYDFVISLHVNHENLSLDDLDAYIEENYHWSDDDIKKIELRLESHLDLLDYYDGDRKC